MTTQAKLAHTLANALGVELELVKAHADALREAKLFPGVDEKNREREAYQAHIKRKQEQLKRYKEESRVPRALR